VFGLTGLVLYNFNGFIVPYLFKRELNILNGRGRGCNLILVFCLIFFVIGGLFGFGYAIYDMLK
jgi:hypothetical protein